MTAQPATPITECPRVVGPSDDGKRLLTCGHTIPCPYHGAPLHVVTPDTETVEGE